MSEKDKPSLYDRIAWHPVVPALCLVGVLFIAIAWRHGHYWLLGITLAVNTIWLIMALSNRSTRGRMVRWMNSDDDAGTADKGNPDDSADSELSTRHLDAKQAALERILGPMDDLVGHAVFPFALGGGLDRYSFRGHLPGTVFATMEIIQPDGSGPRPNRLGTYELVACTRRTRPPTDSGDAPEDATAPVSDYEQREGRVFSILGPIAQQSAEAVLKPGDTGEIPGSDGEPSRCVVFDEFDTRGVRFEILGRIHGLLLVMEIHRSEMDFARQNGTAELLTRLKKAGVHPYSDLDREPVA